MLLIILMYLSAFSIAIVSSYFSIFGLVSLFSGAAIAIAIMGITIEVGKLVMITYLYRYREDIKAIFKPILLLPVFVVIVVTSIGVTGYLSKAYLEQTGPQNNYQTRIERLERRIESQERVVSRNQSILNNLDDALERYIELGYITRGLEQRESQSEQRSVVEGEIRESENRIQSYEDEIEELTYKIQSIELDVGPIRYVAEAVYGGGEENLERAVRLLIIMLIIIIDPFAITILICANHAQIVYKRKQEFDSDTNKLDTNKLDTNKNEGNIERVDEEINEPNEEKDVINSVKEEKQESEITSESIRERKPEQNETREKIKKVGGYKFVDETEKYVSTDKSNNNKRWLNK